MNTEPSIQSSMKLLTIKQSRLKITPFLKGMVMLCALAISVTPCKATLGENLDQSISRYGKPIIPPSPNYANLKGSECVFRKSDYTIQAFFFTGIIEIELLTKNDKSAFTDKEKEAILLTEGGKWTKNTSHTSWDSWIREDGSIAFYYIDHPSMQLSSKKFIDLSQANRDKE